MVDAESAAGATSRGLILSTTQVMSPLLPAQGARQTEPGPGRYPPVAGTTKS